MILTSLDAEPDEFERLTGWAIKPQGACKGDRCVPLGGSFDVRDAAERLGMALVHNARHDLWALGPESGGRALTDAAAPDFALPDWRGRSFTLSSVRGTRVLLLAWASW